MTFEYCFSFLMKSIPSELDRLISEEPPSYDEAVAESINEHRNREEQFDFSSIPEQTVLHFHNCPPLERPSTAEFEIKRAGKVMTLDPLLDDDVEQVWKFFLTHATAPRLHVELHGYHSEVQTETVTDSEGRTETRSKTVDVTDFLVKLDVSKYVCEKWYRMASEPRKNCQPLTIRQTLEEYAQCPNPIKEIHMKKQIMWNIEELEGALKYCIRNTGYSSTVAILFRFEDAKVEVYSSHQWNKIAHTTGWNILCLISCMCIFFYPLYYFHRMYS
jgi:hypothetical protein